MTIIFSLILTITFISFSYRKTDIVVLYGIGDVIKVGIRLQSQTGRVLLS